MAPRSFLRSAQRGEGNRGFVLPIAITAGFVLLLSSASLHSMALMARTRSQARISEVQQLDQLQSAAQVFTQQAIGPQACLLLEPARDWQTPSSRCQGVRAEPLRAGRFADLAWTLVDWQPTSENSGQLEIALADGTRGRARLRLARHPAAVLSIGPMQLLPAAEELG